jgi:hypothetical protein
VKAEEAGNFFPCCQILRAGCLKIKALKSWSSFHNVLKGIDAFTVLEDPSLPRLRLSLKERD